MIFNKFIIFLLGVFITVNNAYAILTIDITEGNMEPLPVAINNFLDSSDNESTLGVQLREVIENDLKNSGLFRPLDQLAFLEKLTLTKTPSFNNWRQINAATILSGRVLSQKGEITVEFKLWDPALETLIEGGRLTIKETSWRRLAHKIADHIYKRLTGEDGYFDSRIVFISESGPLNKRIKKLAIMDQDGANFKELTDGTNLVLTPRFDFKSQRIIYLSYKNKIPQVFLLDLQTGIQKLIGKFKGMTFAPRFSPDGQKAILSVVSGPTTDIFEINLNNSGIKKLTNTPRSINTSPTYSPDGNKIVFNSDRGGSPQLYTMNKDGSDVKRISYGDGRYLTPVWSPRGDLIAFTKSKGGQFYIGVMRSDGSGERLLSSSFMDEGPTWSPNGRVIMFGRQQRGAGSSLYSVDITGYHEHKIPTPYDGSDPAWSPILK